jgi:hypothetical protein
MKDILEKIAKQSVPENTNLWPRIAAQLDERKSLMNIVRTRPLVAILVTLFILLTLSSVAYALGTTLGYIPGIGLVENMGNLRMLAEPVKETRDGVTLTITSVFVYADRVELIYDVRIIDPSNDGSQPQNASEDLKAFRPSSLTGLFIGRRRRCDCRWYACQTHVWRRNIPKRFCDEACLQVSFRDVDDDGA